jgi:GNAT superfamily N-acetyltransferase
VCGGYPRAVRGFIHLWVIPIPLPTVSVRASTYNYYVTWVGAIGPVLAQRWITGLSTSIAPHQSHRANTVSVSQKLEVHFALMSGSKPPMETTTKKTARQRLRKAEQYILSGQFERLLIAVGEKLPSWMFHRNAARLVERNLSSNDAVLEAMETPCCDYCVHEVSREDLSACAELVGLLEVELYRRMAGADRCIAAFSGQQPVHVTWLHFGTCYVRGPSLLIQLNGADCYVYGMFTDPKHQGKGLATRVHRHIVRLCAVRGTTRMVALGVGGKPRCVSFVRETRLPIHPHDSPCDCLWDLHDCQRGPISRREGAPTAVEETRRSLLDLSENRRQGIQWTFKTTTH